MVAGPGGATLYTSTGLSGGELFGTSVAVLGDVDGDGAPDWIGGGRGDDPFPQVHTGAARVMSGSTGLRIRELSSAGAIVDFGASVASAGDTDADGVEDYLVGDTGGRVVVFSGSDGSQRLSLTGDGFAQFGFGVASVGDLDQDGASDLVVSQITGGPTFFRGLTHVYSGRGGGLLFQAPFGGWFKIHADHDFTGDGQADILQGGILTSTRTGQVLQNYGGWLAESIGMNVRASTILDDLDGDGIPEIAFGAPFANSPTAPSVVVVRGRSFYLHVSRSYNPPRPPSETTLTVGEGLAGNPALIILEARNGVPCFCPMGGRAWPLDLAGTFRLTLPNSASWIYDTFQLRGYTLDASGNLLATTPDLLSIR